MKVTFYTEKGEIIQTLCGGTTTHMEQLLSTMFFERVATYTPQAQTTIYYTDHRTGKDHEAVLAVVQPINTTLLDTPVLTNYLP